MIFVTNIRRLGSAILLASSLALGACSTTSKPDPEVLQRDRLAMLEDWMVGSFSSTEQAKADSDYYDIRLRMCRIWPERTDGPWLYVEQATASALDKPYRQRVYRLTATGPQTFVSSVYELPDPARVVGACGEDKALAEFSPEMLTLKDGCAVHLTFHPCSDLFTGGTVGNGCLSSLRGAAYAMSEVSITQHGIVSWDRGFDASGKQVWGAEKGGYRFVRDCAAAH